MVARLVLFMVTGYVSTLLLHWTQATPVCQSHCLLAAAVAGPGLSLALTWRMLEAVDGWEEGRP